MHDVVVVGIPLIAILAGILFSRSDIKELRREMHGELHGLRSEMQTGFAEVRIKVDQIDADLRQFYHLTGKLEARMDALEKRG